MNQKTSTVEIQSYLDDISYPSNKKTLIRYAKEKGAPGDVIRALKDLPDRQYESPIDVSGEFEGDEKLDDDLE